jgi:hypothetical protein
MTIESIELWHKRARPYVTAADFNVQLGCHLEEVAEMLNEMVCEDYDTEDGLAEELVADVHAKVTELAEFLKAGHIRARVPLGNRKAFLDSLADQIVTAVGVGHCAGMQTAKACERVNSSNWTKTVDGEFIRDANGKIAKPATYVAPDLEGLF